MSGLKLYFDAVSPVCRSVMLFLSMNGIPHEVVEISLKNNETKTNQELFEINPNRTIPAINDNGFPLFDSVAILRYLCQKYKVPDHWYPSDLQSRAKVDEALAWFPGNLRCGCFYETCIVPVKHKQPRNEVKCGIARDKLRNSLDIIETYFLKDRKFVGGDQISIADLQFMCECTQYWISQNYIYKGRPNMERWMKDCQDVLSAHFDPIFTKLYGVRDSGTYHYPIDVGQTN